MDVHGTYGYIYQKMFVKHAGTYVVQCKAYSNTPKAHLFAGVAGKDGQGVDLLTVQNARPCLAKSAT